MEVADAAGMIPLTAPADTPLAHHDFSFVLILYRNLL